MHLKFPRLLIAKSFLHRSPRIQEFSTLIPQRAVKNKMPCSALLDCCLTAWGGQGGGLSSSLTRASKYGFADDTQNHAEPFETGSSAPCMETSLLNTLLEHTWKKAPAGVLWAWLHMARKSQGTRDRLHGGLGSLGGGL